MTALLVQINDEMKNYKIIVYLIDTKATSKQIWSLFRLRMEESVNNCKIAFPALLNN